jgi:diacylglycerol kinase
MRSLKPKHRINSFKAAFSGLWQAFQEEANFQIEIVMGFLAIAFGLFLKVTYFEWLVLVLVITGVLVAELFNSVFERLTDLQKPCLDPLARTIKDFSAAAVLVASLGALVAGLIIFGPRLWQILVY